MPDAAQLPHGLRRKRPPPNRTIRIPARAGMRPAAETGGGDAAADGTAFLLGGTGPLTGGAAIYGTAAKQGAEIAVEEINAMGGIQFTLKYEDDQHDPEKAVNAYNAEGLGMQLPPGSVTSKPCEATSARISPTVSCPDAFCVLHRRG